MILENIKNSNYDVVVIGCGHSGLEAGLASARVGAKTAIITMSLDNVGELSCNPSIGGLGKGHLVREIDACGGAMGVLADKAGIQFKVLNASKGPAVQGLRTQISRKAYKKEALKILENQKNLDVILGEVVDIKILDGKISSVVVKVGNEGIEISCSSCVITTGTFTNGLIHMGADKIVSGRVNDNGKFEPAVFGISKFLKENGFDLVRLKTGTPARLKLSSIDVSDLEVEGADEVKQFFSYKTKQAVLPQIQCFITRTNEASHDVIRKAVADGLAPMYAGEIDGTGPRYCPSIEDKVMRFAHNKSHNIFLEPEDLNSDLVYPNGMSTSLGRKEQDDFFHTIKGLENVEIVRYGYAIEYDAIKAIELDNLLQSKRILGLFFAGQINGTSGYEEAACQGLVAGANAGLKAIRQMPFVVDRTNSFTGVLIDDITTNELDEPYRMFTSRSEYRLSIRSDNADLRLSDIANKAGLLSVEQRKYFEEKKRQISLLKAFMSEQKILPGKLKDFGIATHSGAEKVSAISIFKYQGITLENMFGIFPDVKKFVNENGIMFDVVKQVEIESKYEGYLKRQQADIEVFKKDSGLKLPADLDYFKVAGISNELAEKLSKIKPDTIAKVSKISGMTPAGILALLRYIKK